jgi:hypothetical protein
VDLDDLDVTELGERVKTLYGEDVDEATLQRALGTATRTLARFPSVTQRSPDASARVRRPTAELTNDAVVAALRAEILKLLRAH